MVVLYLLTILWLFWYFYVLVMGLYRAKLAGRLSPVATVLAVPALIVGALMDVLVNLTLGSLVFWDPPKQWLLTSRLVRYIERDTGWRGRLAHWICDHLLDVFDPRGAHCVDR